MKVIDDKAYYNVLHQPTYETTYICDECGEEFENEDDLICESICNDCLKNEATIHNAINYGDAVPLQIDINGYLTYIFSTKEINGILKKIAFDRYEQSLYGDREKYQKSAEEFCLQDKEHFFEFLEEQDNIND